MAKQQHLGLEIDLSRDSLFDTLGLQRLRESYMRADEESPQHRFASVCKKFGSNLEHSQRLYEYASKHWISFSTPILSYGRSERGMPISCFLNYIDDSSHGLVNNLSETNWLSMLGGGVGIGFGIRSSDEKSTGVMPHLKTYDSSSLAYRQGKTRRGSYAAYLDINHPDIIQFLEMRKPTGDQNMRCLNLHHGINVSDRFMELVERSMLDSDCDDGWNLSDPFSGEVRETVSARSLWAKILELRMETGEPYLHFIDTSNRALPQTQKDLGLKIHQSNLCSEIILPTSEDRTAVCCLSSVNLENYDAWSKDSRFIKDVAEMLDNVLEFFIQNAPPEVSRATFSAEQERSIGIGALGFHAYLQRKGIALEGVMAKAANNRMFKLIRTRCDEASLELGTERGEAPDSKGTGKRFTHVMAIAPNASSSIIMGNTSPSIEPYRANAYRQDTLSGSYLNKNKYLDELITQLCKDDPKLDYDDTWSSIIATDGSIQHLKIFTEDQKYIFKTAMEIDQRWIIEHAADRQHYIDQAQSLNVFFRPDANIRYIHAIHFMAWKQGVKTMYYCRSEKLGKADKISKKIERQAIKEIDFQSLIDDNACMACE